MFYAAAVLDEVVGAAGRSRSNSCERFWPTYDAERDNRHGHRFIAPLVTRLALALIVARYLHADEASTRAEEAAYAGRRRPKRAQYAALRCQGLIDPRDPEPLLEAVALATRSGRALDHVGAPVKTRQACSADKREKRQIVAREGYFHRNEALGASWFAARATARLRELGGRRGVRGTRDRAVTGLDFLTRSERAVAELVAEGLTNREVGNRLFISPHTVNTHLRHTFQKLDVSDPRRRPRPSLQRSRI